jgi:hypothetical protein
MASKIFLKRSIVVFACILVVGSLAIPAGYAQRGGAAPAGPPPTPKSTAPTDLTGTWTPMITEDWRVRMVTPKKGDYESVPISPAGRQAADAWDPAKDEAAGQQCKAYGAPGLMRVPGRIRISWENDTTLKVETEAGTQTRRFLFVPALQKPPVTPPSTQGTSVANWENVAGGRGNVPRTGNLKVVTTNLTPGYVRKNGVPYSANTVLTEWYDVLQVPGGDTLLIVNTEVVDPLNFNQAFMTNTHFKKLPANAPFTPEACAAR